MPPDVVERKSIGLFTGMAILEERFTSAYFRFNDETAAELKPACEHPMTPKISSVEWGDTVRPFRERRSEIAGHL